MEAAARGHAATLPPGCDVAVVVIDVKAAEIVALVGSADFLDPADGQVNGAVAPRSPGSALKPFLYAAAFDTGRLAPDTVIPDREVAWGAYRPRNFDGEFRGAVPAAEALRRSLNIPAILVAEAVGLRRCLNVLKAAGISLPGDAAARGGLAVATGALEVRLLDLANAYATLARGGIFRPARLFPDEAAEESRAVSAEAAATVSAILSVRERVPASLADRPADSIPWFAWKTGTSSGRRDALAAGHNGRYAVAVWAGRFPGQGDFALTGAAAAEPLLARLFLDPTLAATEDPPPPLALPVRRPFFVEEEAAGPAILSPAPDTVYAALSGAATVTVDVRPATGLALFLNGALLDPPAPATLSVRPGVHELRAVDVAGRAAAVTFTVR